MKKQAKDKNIPHSSCTYYISTPFLLVYEFQLVVQFSIILKCLYRSTIHVPLEQFHKNSTQ